MLNSKEKVNKKILGLIFVSAVLIQILMLVIQSPVFIEIIRLLQRITEIPVSFESNSPLVSYARNYSGIINFLIGGLLCLIVLKILPGIRVLEFLKLNRFKLKSMLPWLGFYIMFMVVNNLFLYFFVELPPATTPKISGLAIAPIPTFIFIVIIGPIFEEILYRGMIFNCLIRMNVRLYAAVIISVLLFTLVHVEKYGLSLGLISVFIFGVIYTMMFYRFNSIYPGILMHSLHNFVVIF